MAIQHAGIAAALVAFDDRDDLLEAAALAMDWATVTLRRRQAANAHEDFYPPMLAHAWMLLENKVSRERRARWQRDIAATDPAATYRNPPGGGNWNVVALCGEALLEQLGLRQGGGNFVAASLEGQLQHFDSDLGLYLEGSMAYDHFPRLWLADLLAHHYAGPHAAETDAAISRAAIVSLFMQSSAGEAPAGGRSAHHQWNEAQQCVTFEIFAGRAIRAGDGRLAGMYKRAAHLALASVRRWVRPGGEMQIVKNWVDPALRHGYESYSAHSQYNLLPMAMLAMAYEHAVESESVDETPAPADVGGYVLEIPRLHKIFANAGGTYVQINASADPHYDATGLTRVHMRGISPQSGPSDSIVSDAHYGRPAGSPATASAGIGISWQDSLGQWRRVAELYAAHQVQCALTTEHESPGAVQFSVTYTGDSFGVQCIVERYALFPDRLEISAELPGYSGPLRFVWPVLADDGRTASDIVITGPKCAVSQGAAGTQTYLAPAAQRICVRPERYANHNGWARLAVAEFAAGAAPRLIISPARDLPPRHSRL